MTNQPTDTEEDPTVDARIVDVARQLDAAMDLIAGALAALRGEDAP